MPEKSKARWDMSPKNCDSNSGEATVVTASFICGSDIVSAKTELEEKIGESANGMDGAKAAAPKMDSGAINDSMGIANSWGSAMSTKAVLSCKQIADISTVRMLEVFMVFASLVGAVCLVRRMKSEFMSDVRCTSCFVIDDRIADHNIEAGLNLNR